MIEQAIILAAGVPSQVGTIAEGRPRAMLPILGKPFAVRIMEVIRRMGINQFTVVLGSKEGLLATYLSESWYPDAEVHFAMHKGGEGTASALLSAREYVDGGVLVAAVEHLLPAHHYERLVNTFDSRATEPALALSHSVQTVTPRATLSGSQVAAIESSANADLPAIISTMALPADFLENIATLVRRKRCEHLPQCLLSIKH